MDKKDYISACIILEHLIVSDGVELKEFQTEMNNTLKRLMEVSNVTSEDMYEHQIKLNI